MAFKNGDVLLFKNRVGEELKVKYLEEDEEIGFSLCIILQVVKGDVSAWCEGPIEDKQTVGLFTSYLSYIAPASLENK